MAELFYIDKHGKRRDASYHEAILASGDHQAALEVTRKRLRARGWIEEQIDKFLDVPKKGE